MLAAHPDPESAVPLLDAALRAVREAADELASMLSGLRALADDIDWQARAVAAFHRDAAAIRDRIARALQDADPLADELAATRARALAGGQVGL